MNEWDWILPDGDELEDWIEEHFVHVRIEEVEE